MNTDSETLLTITVSHLEQGARFVILVIFRATSHPAVFYFLLHLPAQLVFYGKNSTSTKMTSSRRCNKTIIGAEEMDKKDLLHIVCGNIVAFTQEMAEFDYFDYTYNKTDRRFNMSVSFKPEEVKTNVKFDMNDIHCRNTRSQSDVFPRVQFGKENCNFVKPHEGTSQNMAMARERL